MKISLQKDLLNAGLSESEAAIYLAALELGETSVSRLAKKAGVKRTTAYLVLDSLKEKRLMTFVKKDKMMVYFAEDPRKLKTILDERKEKIDKIMPELLAFANSIDRKPEIRYLEGEEGIKDVYRDTLNYPDMEFQAFFSEVFLTRFDEKFFTEFYYTKRLKKKISVRAILPDNEKMREFVAQDQEQLRRSKLAPADIFKLDIELNIYGKNKVGIISFDEQFALIIESQKIHDSLKSIFELVWSTLPEVKSN